MIRALDLDIEREPLPAGAFYLVLPPSVAADVAELPEDKREEALCRHVPGLPLYVFEQADRRQPKPLWIIE